MNETRLAVYRLSHLASAGLAHGRLFRAVGGCTVAVVTRQKAITGWAGSYADAVIFVVVAASVTALVLLAYWQRNKSSRRPPRQDRGRAIRL